LTRGPTNKRLFLEILLPSVEYFFELNTSSIINHSMLSAVSGGPEHSTAAAQCLQTALVVTSSASAASLPMTSDLHSLVTQCCLVQLWSVDPVIRKAYAELLCCVPLDKVMQ